MQESLPSRRRFIKSAIATVGLAGAGMLEADCTPEKNSRSKSSKKEIPKEKEAPREAHKVIYQMGSLEGRTFPSGSLFSYFTGIEGRVSREEKIDFKDRLKYLFEKKESFVQRHNRGAGAYKQAADSLVVEYNTKSPDKMDLRTYQIKVAGAIEEVRESIDWNKVQVITGLNVAQAEVLKAITRSLSPRHLTAYALTELMPGEDGVLSRDFYEFLLKNAGSRYAYSVPAIFDDRLSFGPYQFTSYALMDTGRDPVGASSINRALPENKRIPGSVLYLRGNDHHKAALLFAMYNLARLIKQLSPKELNTLKVTGQHNLISVTEFIATAHHLPAPAFSAARRWLDNGAKQDYEISCSGPNKQYARKTHQNLVALQALNY